MVKLVVVLSEYTDILLPIKLLDSGQLFKLFNNICHLNESHSNELPINVQLHVIVMSKY